MSAVASIRAVTAPFEATIQESSILSSAAMGVIAMSDRPRGQHHVVPGLADGGDRVPGVVGQHLVVRDERAVDVEGDELSIDVAGHDRSLPTPT